MAEVKKRSYKYCIVPMCKSTTFKSPNKIFFHVPKDINTRKKWCKLMRRDLIGPKSTTYVCEDHFDVENDTENFIKYRLVGGTLKLKAKTCPHKFYCQKPLQPEQHKGAYEKRRRIEFYEKLLTKEEPSTSKQSSSLPSFEMIECDNMEVEFNEIEDPLPEDINFIESVPDKKRNKRVQANITVSQKNKAVQTIIIRKSATDTGNKCQEIGYESPPSGLSSLNSSLSKLSLFSLNSNSSDSSSSHTIKLQYYNDTKKKITTNLILYMGLPEEIFFLTKLLSESVAIPVRDILMSLKKIRLDDSYARLALDFDICKSSVSKIFTKTVSVIADRMKQLIYFPPIKEIREKLPISFRKRYSATVSILDCFEIRIEKPSDAMQQAMTWSEYKHCNTIKYLISITPDGLINFISEGYGGRASDTIIFEDCGFLQYLSPTCSVMADRGFKNVSHLLEGKRCHLIRPPSVTQGKASSKLEVMETKRIAALRINVERTIGRLRIFSMVAPHACIDTKVIYLLDSIVIIACAIVNVQRKLIHV